MFPVSNRIREAKNLPHARERQKLEVRRLDLALLFYVSLDRFDLERERIDRCLAHLAHAGDVIVVAEMGARAVFSAQDVMARDLLTAGIRERVELHCAAFHTFLAGELTVSTASWKGVL